jgi:acylphosphatase
MAVRYDIIFTGRVQGVGFRFTACRAAEAYPGLSGWVRNERDGSVTCVAEGEEHQLDRFVQAIQKKMAGCIEQMHINRGPARGDLTGFVIRR